MKIKASQQSIVFCLFVLMFSGFLVFLPGFAQIDNLLTLVQNVAFLGILGLGMAVVVIGRGIDISMVAALAVPSGLLLQMVQSGYSLSGAFFPVLALALAFGLVNGWLIAYAEVSALFSTLASGLFLAGLGQAYFFPVEVVQWPQALDALAWLGRGSLAGLPTPVVMFAAVAAVMALFLQRMRAGAFIYAVGDNPLAARASGLPTRPVMVLDDERTVAFDLPRNSQSILEAGNTHGLELPYSCKAWVCSTCRCKVIEGEVEMDNNFALEDYEVASVFILSCQSFPLSYKVILDYDQP